MRLSINQSEVCVWGGGGGGGRGGGCKEEVIIFNAMVHLESMVCSGHKLVCPG